MLQPKLNAKQRKAAAKAAAQSEVINEQSEVIIITNAISSENKASAVATATVLRKLRTDVEQIERNNKAAAIRYDRKLTTATKAATATKSSSTTAAAATEKKYAVNNMQTSNKHELAANYIALFLAENITVNGIKSINDVSRLSLSFYFKNSGLSVFIAENNNAKFDINDIRFSFGRTKLFATALRTFRTIAFLRKPNDYKYAAERLVVYFTHSKTFDFIKALQK